MVDGKDYPMIRRTRHRIGSSFSPQDAETTTTKMDAEKVDMSWQEEVRMNFLPRFLRADGLFRILTCSTDSFATCLNLGKKLHAHAICWAGSSIVTHICVCVTVCVCTHTHTPVGVTQRTTDDPPTRQEPMYEDRDSPP